MLENIVKKLLLPAAVLAMSCGGGTTTNSVNPDVRSEFASEECVEPQEINYEDNIDAYVGGDSLTTRTIVCYQDKDGDGYPVKEGNIQVGGVNPVCPESYITVDKPVFDCNDNSPKVHELIDCKYDGKTCGDFNICVEQCPATPVDDCDSTDNDCDGLTDENLEKIVECKDGTSYTQNCENGVWVDKGMCIPVNVLGCTDPKATNYNPKATKDNGGCEYNSCPVWNQPLQDLVASEGQMISLTLMASDVDEDALIYLVKKFPELGTSSFNSSTGEFTYTPDYAAVLHPATENVDSVTFVVSDKVCEIEQTLNIVVKDVNRCPVIYAAGVGNISLGDKVTFKYDNAEDPDTEDKLTFSLKEGCVGSMTSDGSYEFTPTCKDVGEHKCTVQVTDGICVATYDSFIVHVKNTSSCDEGCLDGKIEKMECETTSPCKGYQTRTCVEGKWGDWSGCEDRIHIADGAFPVISGNKVAFLSNRIVPFSINVYDLETNSTIILEEVNDPNARLGFSLRLKNSKLLFSTSQSLNFLTMVYDVNGGKKILDLSNQKTFCSDIDGDNLLCSIRNCFYPIGVSGISFIFMSKGGRLNCEHKN